MFDPDQALLSPVLSEELRNAAFKLKTELTAVKSIQNSERLTSRLMDGHKLFTVNPPIRPSIIGTSVHDDGSLELTVRYQPGKRVAIEASTFSKE